MTKSKTIAAALAAIAIVTAVTGQAQAHPRIGAGIGTGFVVGALIGAAAASSAMATATPSAITSALRPLGQLYPHRRSATSPLLGSSPVRSAPPPSIPAPIAKTRPACPRPGGSLFRG